MDRPEERDDFDALPIIPASATKYEILGVRPDATAAEIKVAYRRQALLYHPDRHSEDNWERAAEVFKRIGSSYRTLSNDRERVKYDRALARGNAYEERVGEEPELRLADILNDLYAFEHIFSSEKHPQLTDELRQIVRENLAGQLGEEIVGVWSMSAAPAKHEGTFAKGAVVLTNLRVLLPFTYTWEVTQGSTKYKYRGARMPIAVLPLVERLVIRTQNRLRSKVIVEIRANEVTTVFQPAQRNLGKLLLVASLWGIPIEGTKNEAKGRELVWALLNPLLWAAGATGLVFLVAAGLGLFAGAFIEAPVAVGSFAGQHGLFPWLVIITAVISARNLWRWSLAYQRVDPGSILTNDPSAQSRAAAGVRGPSALTTARQREEYADMVD